jgi:hypothetical protein
MLCGEPSSLAGGAALQDFERRHPEDARQEDSTFLRAVARARRGDAAGARATAQLRASWSGHVDNERAAERVPVQFAWKARAVLLPETTVNFAEAADRALLREVWSEHASRSWYAEQVCSPRRAGRARRSSSPTW